MTIDRRRSIASLVFFLSGCSALIFETVWFRVTSIVLGSSVWSAAAVLMAFMTGLAIGNAVMMLLGRRCVRVFRLYVIIEIVIAVFGVAVVALLPAITPQLSALLAALTERQDLLNIVRFLVAFSVLLTPAIAMGATLPILLKGLHALDASFSAALGRLYGWNTVGAVAGAIVSEFLLIDFLGITHSAYFAALANLCAALLVLKYLGVDKTFTEPASTPQVSFARRNLFAVLLVPGILGLVLLALEVVWFRYLLLAHNGTSIVFATMLAIVLAGIGIGSLIAARINTRGNRLDRLIMLCLLAGSLAVAGSFRAFDMIYTLHFEELTRQFHLFVIAACVLMLPNSIASGILFPLLGEKLHRSLTVSTTTSGLLTLTNTIGAALGSGIATFVLLPEFGVERSLLVLSAGYLIAAAVWSLGGTPAVMSKWRLAGPVATALVLAAIFPYNALERAYATFAKRMLPKEQLVLIAEGLNETLQYYRVDLHGSPAMYRLVTNGFSMSATNFASQRYMKFFVYLPYLLKDDFDDVLLVSYGVGNTAEAIAGLPEVKRFDVVDLSRDVLRHSEIIHASSGAHPLEDSRARVHVEDGRFYLQTTQRRFDLITGEPPPPKHAGVVNLYTREYFDLMKSRLKSGGVATYWLPAHDLYDSDSLAIIKAFCLSFEDCSLWAPAGFDFVLMGTRTGMAPSDQLNHRFSRIAGRLADIGYENLSLVLSSFVADAPTLLDLSRNIAPVSDDFPNRISPDEQGIREFSSLYALLLDASVRAKAFAGSQYLRALLSPSDMQAALLHFKYESMYTALLAPDYMGYQPPTWEQLIDLLSNTDFQVLPALSLGTSPVEMDIVDTTTDKVHDVLKAKIQLIRRNYTGAAETLREHLQTVSDDRHAQRLALLASGLDASITGAWSDFDRFAEVPELAGFADRLRRRLGAAEASEQQQ